VSTLEALAEIGPDYEHIEKIARPEARLTLGETTLKWYDIAPEDKPVPLAIRALARRNLRDGAKFGELAITPSLGFVILHRCGESFYFLIASTWRNDNELWQTVWAKQRDDEHAFHPWVIEGTHKPTFCVWELGAVCYEREAWSAFLRSPRGQADVDAYLRSSYSGTV
jgi:hypothetical protein